MKAEELREARQRLQLTQAALAELLCVSWRTVARWEAGGTIPRPMIRLIETLALEMEREEK